MIAALNQACHRSSDPPDSSPLVVAQPVHTGRRGRPCIEIDPAVLSYALTLRGPSHLAGPFHCSSRTVRHRALEQGLVAPAPPVYSDQHQPDGTVLHAYTSTTRPVSTLTDHELDTAVAAILEVFPSFGRRLLNGRLKAEGHHVPRERLMSSYLRVHGTPGIFGDRTIHRRRYNVAGTN